MASEKSPYSTQVKKKVKKKFRAIFLEKYYTNYGYHFYASVYDYLTGGSVFKIDDLVQQLKVIYNISENIILPQYEILNKLNFHQWTSLSEKEYMGETKKMLEYCDKGDYDIHHYLNVFFLAERFNNPFHSNLKNLEKRIIKGMRKGISRYKYSPFLESYLAIDNNSLTVAFQQRIKDEAISINKRLNKIVELSELKELNELFYSDLDAFIFKVSYRSDKYVINEKYLSIPIFTFFSFREFYSFILKTDNSTRWKIMVFLEKRYNMIHFPDLLKPEIDFFANLKTKIDKKASSKPRKGPSNFIFSQFNNVLEVILKKIKQNNK